MSRILIVGDSWGEGEWNYLCSKHKVIKSVCKCPYKVETYYEVSHRGLEKYLLDHGCYVRNLSSGGCNNLFSLNQITDWRAQAFDYIFWFVTDPLRDIQNKSKDKLIARDATEMESLIDRFMLNALDVANRKAQHFDNGIHIIGGVYSPKLEHLDQYDHIHIGCHSFLELLSTIQLPKDYHGYCVLPSIRDTNRLRLEEGALDYLDRTGKTFKQIMEQLPYEYCVRDDPHVNRVAHKVLYDHLCENFEFTPYNG